MVLELGPHLHLEGQQSIDHGEHLFTLGAVRKLINRLKEGLDRGGLMPQGIQGKDEAPDIHQVRGLGWQGGDLVTDLDHPRRPGLQDGPEGLFPEQASPGDRVLDGLIAFHGLNLPRVGLYDWTGCSVSERAHRPRAPIIPRPPLSLHRGSPSSRDP